MNVIVADSPNDGPFLQFENNNLGVWPVRRIFDTQLHIFKKLRVPEGLEVAAQSLFVVGVIVAAENPSFQCVVADAPVPDKINAFDDCWLFGLLLGFLRTGRAPKPRLFSPRRTRCDRTTVTREMTAQRSQHAMGQPCAQLKGSCACWCQIR